MKTDAALFADVYGGRIGRLWRLGEGDAGECERAVSVAFDPDLSQVRGDIAFREEDHPELEPSGMGAIRQAAAVALEPLRAGGALRVRGFVIRALGDDRAAAALIAVYVLWDDTPRAMQSGYAAVGVAPGRAPLAVFDRPPTSAWAPRL